jgi:hypothetical protein
LEIQQQRSFSLKNLVMILGVAAPGPVNANIILSTDMTET